MHDVTVIDDPAAAEASLDPIRARLLAELAAPGSASTLSGRVGLTRQKANYHLRALERHGLVELVEERRKGNCTERVLQATAASYVISPAALSPVAPDPSRAPDQRSARWLLAVADRLVVRMESPDGTFNALDYTIEAREGGTAHLRYVHSGILADGWEDQYDAIDGHTDFYLHTLAEYLAHFNGRPVTYVGRPSSGI